MFRNSFANLHITWSPKKGTVNQNTQLWRKWNHASTAEAAWKSCLWHFSLSYETALCVKHRVWTCNKCLVIQSHEQSVSALKFGSRIRAWKMSITGSCNTGKAWNERMQLNHIKFLHECVSLPPRQPRAWRRSENGRIVSGWIWTQESTQKCRPRIVKRSLKL